MKGIVYQVVLELFKKVAAEHGQTFLVVTHEEDFAAKSDRTIHIEDGKIC